MLTITQQGAQWCHSCEVNLRVCDWLPLERIPERESCVDARISKGKIMCRVCDMSMGLGSSSLTMVELSRAYSTFATYGTVVEPYYIEAVKDRNGQIIESHTPVEAKRVLEPNVAAISHYLLREVATGGTAAKTNNWVFKSQEKRGQQMIISMLGLLATIQILLRPLG